MMLVSDLFRMSCHNLLLHKVRSILTSLGVIFGVGSVIAMLAISEGAKRKALEQIEAMGIDKILVYAKKPPVTGTSEGNDKASLRESYGLVDSDYKHMLQMDNVDNISIVRDARKRVLKGLERMDIKLIAVEPDFLDYSASDMDSGRWFSPGEFDGKSGVCVIGTNVKRKMFSLGQRDIVGSVIRVEDQVFRVVGILDNTVGTQYPELNSPNDMILIPLPLSRSLYRDYSYVREGSTVRMVMVEYDIFIIKVRDLEHIDNTAKRIAAYMGKTHSKVKDWDILVPLDLLKQREATQNIFTIVMSSIAGISLIVGGIGIMNIMLASVFERRKEIGTRRALGAQKSDILLQFLIETVFLTSLGGILGILLGIGISQAVTAFADMPTIYSMWSIVVSLFISSFVGVVFGTYPAWKAAQQNPIEVLRAN